MKKIIACILCCIALCASAQETKFSATSVHPGPFASIGITDKPIVVNGFDVIFKDEKVKEYFGWGFNKETGKMEYMLETDSVNDTVQRVFDNEKKYRWLSMDPVLKAHESPYVGFANNPIIFIDPDGRTEFYYRGKWIGSDGLDNNLLAKVTSAEVKREIKKSTQQGLHFNWQSIGKAAENKNGMLLINRDVLSYSFHTLNRSLTSKGKVGEFGNTMTRDGDYYNVTGEMRYEEGLEATIPSTGDVSIHSHPTGLLDADGRFVSANEPTADEPNNLGDESAFKKFETNIIVGKNGDVTSSTDTETGKRTFDESGRYPAINIFSNNYKDKIGTIEGGEAGKMLEGNRGGLGKKFDKKTKAGN